MRSKKPDNTAFTLTELMIAVVLVGVIATFGIPSYTKAVNRTKEKDAVANLELIREAVRLYMSREGGATPLGLADVSAINTTFKLNILGQGGNTYQCATSNIYTCRVTNADGWQVQFQLDFNNGDIFCSIAACPTL